MEAHQNIGSGRAVDLWMDAHRMCRRLEPHGLGGCLARPLREVTVLRFLGLLLVVWLVLTVVGAIVKGLFWLAVVGLVFFVATAALGWNKREHKALPRRW